MIEIDKERWLNAVNKIKSDYGFDVDFDLNDRISHLPTSVSLYKSQLENSERPSEMRTNISQLKKDAQNFIKHLKDSGLSTKLFIGETPTLYATLGYNILQKQTQGWYIRKFEDDLCIFHKLCEKALSLWAEADY